MLFRSAFVALLVYLFPICLMAQEKDLSYYDHHASEILPDAQNSFKLGNYERTIELCNWHYIIVGDDAADSLRNMAERCAKLSTEMDDLHTTGKIKDAKEVARTLLSINPNDAAARKILEESEEPDMPIPIDTVVTDVPIIADTLVKENPLPNEIQVEEKPQEQVQIIDVNPNPDSVQNASGQPREHTGNGAPRTMFVLKAGASLVDLKQIAHSVAPGGSLGLYDLGGSRIGAEVGGYYCSNLNSTVSLFGIDVFAVIRAAKGFYPKFGVGYFSYNPVSAVGSAVHGLCGGVGLTFLLGGHFCLDVGAKYYPAFSILYSEQAITSGISYQFPVVKQFYSGGLSPMISIGWAF